MKLQLIILGAVLLSSPLVWKVPKFWSGKVMMLTTFLVLIYADLWSVTIMLSVAVLQWLLWKFPSRNFRRVYLLFTILLPLLPLLIYKIGNNTDNWLIPLGLSYYAFRQIHAAFEVFKGNLVNPPLEEYLQYLLFLPVMLVGPIHRMPEMQRSIRRHKWQAAEFSDGLERILYGMVKINFLGNYIFSFKLPGWAAFADSARLTTYLNMMAFTGNAYVQFSGYSDLAIGMGLLWGIRVMENFNYPFLATNMQEFWQRWHISLSSWCRDYVFQPIVAFTRSRWLALAMAMLVLALWHEISLRYILWGIFHSILITVTVMFRKNLPVLSAFINHHYAGKWLGRLWVLHMFALSCLLISTENYPELWLKLKLLFGYV